MFTYLHVVDVTRGTLLLSGRVESTRILFLDLPKRACVVVRSALRMGTECWLLAVVL